MKFVSLLSLILFLSSGCGESGRQAPGPPVSQLDAAGLDSLLLQRHGRWLFLNVWATWCLPCREEFPGLLKVKQQFRSKPVEFAALSVDYPDETDTRIRPFLQSVKSDFQHFVQNFPEQADLINRLDSDWSGGLPATFIFDPRGKRRLSLKGEYSTADFSGKLDSLLKL